MPAMFDQHQHVSVNVGSRRRQPKEPPRRKLSLLKIIVYGVLLGLFLIWLSEQG